MDFLSSGVKGLTVAFSIWQSYIKSTLQYLSVFTSAFENQELFIGHYLAILNKC